MEADPPTASEAPSTPTEGAPPNALGRLSPVVEEGSPTSWKAREAGEVHVSPRLNTLIFQQTSMLFQQSMLGLEEPEVRLPSPSALRHHELNLYRACAREFHETGGVKSSRDGIEARRGAV
eukprot:EG_transcript_54040